MSPRRRNAGLVSHPRAAALQGVAKMRAQSRASASPKACSCPSGGRTGRWLAELGTTIEAAPRLAAARRVLRLGDVGGQCGDRLPRRRYRRRPLPSHRRQSADDAAPQPRMARDARPAPPRLRRRGRIRVHPPVPPAFGDEGAANHMRLAASHDAPGVEVFVYGARGGAYPARQHRGSEPRGGAAAPARSGANPVRLPVGGGDRRRRLPQRCRRGRERACPVRARAGVRGSRRLLCRAAAASARRSRSSRCRRAPSASRTRSAPICSTPSW